MASLKHATSVIEMYLLHLEKLGPFLMSKFAAFLKYFGVFSIFDVDYS